MQTEIVSHTVLARMKSVSGEDPAVSLIQIRMFSLTLKGARYVEELAAASAEQ